MKKKMMTMKCLCVDGADVAGYGGDEGLHRYQARFGRLMMMGVKGLGRSCVLQILAGGESPASSASSSSQARPPTRRPPQRNLVHFLVVRSQSLCSRNLTDSSMQPAILTEPHRSHLELLPDHTFERGSSLGTSLFLFAVRLLLPRFVFWRPKVPLQVAPFGPVVLQ